MECGDTESHLSPLQGARKEKERKKEGGEKEEGSRGHNKQYTGKKDMERLTIQFTQIDKKMSTGQGLSCVDKVVCGMCCVGTEL